MSANASDKPNTFSMSVNDYGFELVSAQEFELEPVTGKEVFSLPTEFDEIAPAGNRAPFALFSLALVVTLMVSGVLPNVHAALIGCLLMGLFGCIDLQSAYRSIYWQSLLLIVGMLLVAWRLEGR